MFNEKKTIKVIFLTAALAVCSIVLTPFQAHAESEELYLGGFPAGFALDTTRVEVVGLCDVLTKEGMCSPARAAGIKCGDIIDKINGEEVNQTSDINRIISIEYKKYELDLIRDGNCITVEVSPVIEIASGGKRLGVLVKDSVSGIGTVTYIDKYNNKFASLGHPITDADNNIIEINGGTVFGSLIYDVKKGVRGVPGELKGAFESGTVIGSAKINCSCGVFGDLAENYKVSKLERISKASLDKVEIGTAYIYSTVYGNTSEKYKISIVKVDKDNRDNRNFVLKIEDKALLEKTGGIVQGMSGSPIVQNGKLIGAVTHVFVNDPTRGYGIGIDNMLGSY